MENPPCEIIQQQSQRYSHQSNGDSERMVQSLRNQIKAYKVQLEKNSGITIKDDSPLLVTSTRCTAIHAIPQAARFHNNSVREEDSTHVLPKSHFICWRSSCMQTTKSIDQQIRISMVSRCWLGRDSKTDEHLIGTPNGMVRSRASQSGKTALGYQPPERDGLGSVEPDPSYDRKTRKFAATMSLFLRDQFRKYMLRRQLVPT